MSAEGAKEHATRVYAWVPSESNSNCAMFRNDGNHDVYILTSGRGYKSAINVCPFYTGNCTPDIIRVVKYID